MHGCALSPSPPLSHHLPGVPLGIDSGIPLSFRQTLTCVTRCSGLVIAKVLLIGVLIWILVFSNYFICYSVNFSQEKANKSFFVLLFLLMLLGFLLLFFKFCAYESFEIMIIFCCVPGGFSCLCSCVSGGLFMLLVFFKLLFKEGKCQH